MISPNDSPPPGMAVRLPAHPLARHYWQPVIAYVLLVIACLWAIIPNRALNIAGHLLGEHTFSIYNLLLAAAAILMFLRARLSHDSTIAWRVFDLSLCSAIVSWGLKLSFNLPRPSGGPYGFPSGHALTAFAASSLLMEAFPNVSPFAFLIAVAVGWSRVEIHEHYTYQVLIGALLGMLIGYFVTRAPRGVGVLLPRVFVRRRPPPTVPRTPGETPGVWPPPPSP
jgi:membrane-associated phospholipid phosphatase